MSERARHWDYCIVGGGIAGVTAAETIRTHDAEASIAVFEAEGEYLYSRVLLPNYVRGLALRERVFLRNRDDYAQKNIAYVRNTTMQQLDCRRREIIFEQGERAHYGKLLFATGARVVACPFDIPEHLAVFRLQTLHDADMLREALEHPEQFTQPVAIIGGGFIALELIQAFADRGIPTEVFLKDEGYFGERVSPEFAQIIHRLQKGRGVTLHGHSTARGITVQGGTYQLSSDHGTCAISAIALGIGVSRNIHIAANAGLAVGRGIHTDAYLRTSDPSVFAAGDVAEYLCGNSRLMSGNWSTATAQGMVAGENMAGGERAYHGTPIYRIVHFNVPISFVGTLCTAQSRTVVRREAGEQYAEFYFLHDILHGAACIGMSGAISTIAKWVEHETMSIARADRLADTNIPLTDV